MTWNGHVPSLNNPIIVLSKERRENGDVDVWPSA